MAKVIRTFEEFVAEVQKAAEKKTGLTAEQAQWVLKDQSIQQLCGVGFRINYSPAKVWEAITAGLVSAWVKHNMMAEQRKASGDVL